MKWIADVIGVLLILVGIFWALQGTNTVPYGAMAGRSRWTVIGLLLGVVGVGVLLFVNV